jgi:hypothetical protein
MEMEIVKPQESNLKRTIKDILEISEQTIGIAASPSLFWLIVLYNSMGGQGFSGHVVNKPTP